MAAMNNALQNHCHEMLGDAFAPIQELLLDPAVREVMINGADDVWVEINGQLHQTACLMDQRQIRNSVRLLASLSQRDQHDRQSGFLLDAAFDGLRISAVLAPVSRTGDVICIRKLSRSRRPVEDFVQSEIKLGEDLVQPFELSHRWQGQLARWVSERRNLLISGSTSSGKTTFLNALADAMSPEDRVLVMEDPQELTLHLPNHLVFEANSHLQVTLRDLVRQSLRFRPDRLIVGEVRGAEAFDLIQAMNTGHEGCLGTLHANSALDALSRLEQLVLQAGVHWPMEAISRQIASSVHGVVHLDRRDGVRRIREMIEVKGYENGQYRVQHIPQ
jgi:Flp pilus assembly CpaF family ATPase